MYLHRWIWRRWYFTRTVRSDNLNECDYYISMNVIFLVIKRKWELRNCTCGLDGGGKGRWDRRAECSRRWRRESLWETKNWRKLGTNLKKPNLLVGSESDRWRWGLEIEEWKKQKGWCAIGEYSKRKTSEKSKGQRLRTKKGLIRF